jgi:hypothetical protein
MCGHSVVSGSDWGMGGQIEEGEVDTERGRQFSACFRKLHKKDQDTRLAEQRKEKAAAKGKK